MFIFCVEGLLFRKMLVKVSLGFSYGAEAMKKST